MALLLLFCHFAIPHQVQILLMVEVLQVVTKDAYPVYWSDVFLHNYSRFCIKISIYKEKYIDLSRKSTQSRTITCNVPFSCTIHVIYILNVQNSNEKRRLAHDKCTISRYRKHFIKKCYCISLLSCFTFRVEATIWLA